MSDESELLRAYSAGGEEEAFSECMRRYQDYVYSIAMLRTNRDSAMAAEVTQNVFITLSRRASALVGHGALHRWLYVATCCQVVDAKRSAARRRQRETEAYIIAEASTGCDSPVAPADLLRALSEELDALRPEERDVLLLRFIRGMDFSTISALLGLPEKTARTRASRALGKIRRSLSKRGITSSTALIAAAFAKSRITAPIDLLEGIAASVGAKPSVLTGVAVVVKWPLALGVAGIAALAGFFSRPRDSQALPASDSPQLGSLGILGAEGSQLIESPPPPISFLVPPVPRNATQHLRERLAMTPSEWIPEVQLVEDSDWERITRIFPPDSEENILRLFQSIRNRGRVIAARELSAALNRFIEENDGLLPSSVTDLRSKTSLLPAEIFSRYAMLRQGDVKSWPRDELLIAGVAGIDGDSPDSLVLFGRTRRMTLITGDRDGIRIGLAIMKYMSANDGQVPNHPGDVAHFLTVPLESIDQSSWNRFRSPFVGAPTQPGPTRNIQIPLATSDH